MMRQVSKLRAPISAAIIGGLLGILIGAFLGSELGAMVSFSSGGYVGPRWPSELGRVLGMAAGLACGSFLGLLLVDRPRVARWCIGSAITVGAVLFLVGFAGAILRTPNSPQGPLWEIFFKGPFGVVIGAIIGLYIGVMRERRQGREGSRKQRSLA